MRGTAKDRVSIEIYQHDWIPGFAAFHHNGKLRTDAKAHVVLNIGSLLAVVAEKKVEPSEVPYIVAQSIMHEVIHALEAWARVEFSEDRVEGLIDAYRTRVAELADARALKPRSRKA